MNLGGSKLFVGAAFFRCFLFFFGFRSAAYVSHYMASVLDVVLDAVVDGVLDIVVSCSGV